MKTEVVSLNLSRKWRSQNFDQIVGQDLSVRILKNSLYLGHYFPVYLFAGQRGCGKTSTARIFAAALNCQALPAFQKDPKNFSIPCLTCNSCSAMQNGKHPDFIEIDAASYTGVDHMRNIIESSSLLPIMGNKRVYLIDEAHMLSKAAFNAALKILEEPPATALFILATTNPYKIIDTVRSRCFQLFFVPIVHDSLKNHLKNICKKENIAHDNEALDIIVRHTQGSARDALNVLEQVRFSSAVVNKNAVLKLLRHMNDQQLLDIIKITINGSACQLLSFIDTLSIEQYAADFVWQRLMTLLRALIWLKHGVNPKSLVSSDMMLHDVAQVCLLSDLHRMVQALYENEELFLKTPMQHALLEMILLNLCQKDQKKTDNSGGAAPCSVNISSVDICSEESEDDINVDDKEESLQGQNHGDDKTLWLSFVEYVIGLNDPLLNSLFKQARFISYDSELKKVSVEFAKDLILFQEWLENARSVWQPILRKIFSTDVQLEALFTGVSTGPDKSNKNISERTQQQVTPQRSSAVVSSSNGVKQPEKTIPVSASREQFFGSQQQYKKKIAPIQQRNEVVLDVSDESKWKMASMLIRHFPGVVTEIRENR